MKLIRELSLLVFAIQMCSGTINFPLEKDEFPSFNLTALELQSTKLYEDTVDYIISGGVLKLTLSIAKFLSYTNLSNNVVYAPVNIAGALALVLLGSHGKTFQELSDVLGLASGIDIQNKSQKVHQQFGRIFDKLDRTTSFDIGEEIKLATGIFVQVGFPIRNVFKQTSETIYGSEVLNVDFKENPDGAKNTINTWVSDRTGGKIKTMLEDNPQSATKVIIASALYFKAAWEKPFFSVQHTRREPFYPNGLDNEKNVKMVDLMTNAGLFPYFRDHHLDCEIIGFPYKENKTTMFVIKPFKSNSQKLAELQDKLTPAEIERLVDNTRYTQTMIAFPKMTLESKLDLTDALKDFGAKSLFDPYTANLALLSPGQPKVPPTDPQPLQSNPVRYGEPENCTQIFDPSSNITKCLQIDQATQKEIVYKKFGDKVGRRINGNAQLENIDFVRNTLDINENPGLYADQVLHKVYMDITETGTEASASTSVGLTRGGDITRFIVNVPFLFFIRNHETRIVLFYGAVNSPTPSFS